MGTGTQIKVWHDAWLPSPSTFKVVSPIRVIDKDATVDSLIDNDLMVWDVVKLRLGFLPRDMEIIQQIPLSHRRPKDRQIWMATRNGIFTVKSAYQLLLRQQH